MKSSQNAVNLKKTQIALLQSVELKVKALVHAFETTVRSITVRVTFFGGERNEKWREDKREGRVTRDNIEMAWALA